MNDFSKPFYSNSRPSMTRNQDIKLNKSKLTITNIDDLPVDVEKNTLDEYNLTNQIIHDAIELKSQSNSENGCQKVSQ